MKVIKPRFCKQCGNSFKPYNTIQPVCSPACALKFNSEKEVKKRVKEMKKDSQSLNDLRAIARAVFQTYIRLRDEKEPCFSCKRTKTEQWDGSHLFSAEQYSGVIFNEMNVHKCCCYCNRNLYGNILEYRKNFVLKFGQEAYDALEKLANETRYYKYSPQELRDIATEYKLKIKNLKNKSKNGNLETC